MVAWMRRSFPHQFPQMASKFFCVLSLLLLLTGCQNHLGGLLNPKGLIALEERKLFFDTLALMLIVVLPVIIMSLAFIYHYQSSHRIRDYKPNWAHSYLLESLWWGIPCVIIVILAVVTWKKTHELDPYRPIAAAKEKPILIQAIALPWKWLFIYPNEDIATVNYVVVPVNRQVEYWTTTDNVPMSAIFIPQLGSQIFAMAGMRTRLHLIANETGVFVGENTQYNGDGFSDMHFKAYSVTPEEMQTWIAGVKARSQPLNQETYRMLLKPQVAAPQETFAGIEKNLFNNVIMLYMHTFGTKHPRYDIEKLQREEHE